jgi:hypothetical protein
VAIYSLNLLEVEFSEVRPKEIATWAGINTIWQMSFEYLCLILRML